MVTMSSIRWIYLAVVIVLVTLGWIIVDHFNVLVAGNQNPAGHSCEQIDPNGYIHINSQADAERLRQQIISQIWSGRGFPANLPQSVDRGIQDKPWQAIEPTEYDFLVRVDQLKVELPLGFISRIYQLIPDAHNNRLVIIHQGHINLNSEAGGYGIKEAAGFFLEQGFSVILIYMPETGPNEGPIAGRAVAAHNEMARLESAAFNPLLLFMEPIAAVMNYVEENFD